MVRWPAPREIADFLDGKALIAFTQSGDTARRLSRYRACQPILAFTTDESTRNQLSLTWGVETYVVPHVDSTDEMVELVDAELGEAEPLQRRRHRGHHGRFAPGVPGTTDMVGCTTRAAASATDPPPPHERRGRPLYETGGALGRLCAVRSAVLDRGVQTRHVQEVPPNCAACVTFTLVKYGIGRLIGGGFFALNVIGTSPSRLPRKLLRVHRRLPVADRGRGALVRADGVLAVRARRSGCRSPMSVPSR
ncbi:pyruvate kinase alpha/beta domain-containing protein [Streptomyces sp. KL116D]|uniref:pyruvate kinase alpha/beta domain-containing protein n=1 Tax=Streptomyces sp. KL116D TaxID=3045152 RepID=UPI0035566DF8